MSINKINPGKYKWIAAQIGAREYYAIPRMLDMNSSLVNFYTDIWAPNSKPLNYLPIKINKLKRRYSDQLDKKKVTSRNLSSIFVDIKNSDGNFTNWINRGKYFSSWVAKDLLNNYINDINVCFSYTCGSLELFRKLQNHNILKVLGQFDPGISWYKTRHEELELWPNAEKKLSYPTENFIDRMQEEWNLADTIIVNSLHSKISLTSEGVSGDKIKILPLAYEETSLNFSKRSLNKKKPFRILFVGNICLAKGFQYFGEASRILNNKNYEFIAAGNIYLDTKFIQQQNWKVTYLGYIGKKQLEIEFQHADVLVFPTLSDGFGMIQLEAQTRGLPVISTSNCGDVITHEVNGYRIPIRNSVLISQYIEKLSLDADLYEKMSQESINNAKNFNLVNISQQLNSILD